MSQGPKSLVVGFNHNIKYRGQTYHAQTEDTGAPRCQVVTHLFLGGNVVASKRTGYGELTGAGNLPELVRGLMEEQHKEILRNLVHGVYDRAAAGAPASEVLAGDMRAGEVPAGDPRAGQEWAGDGPAPARTPEEAPPRRRDVLFAHDLISERSLDEVILAYLAGDAAGRGR